MSKLVQVVQPAKTKYIDQRWQGTQEDYQECLRKSTTVYVGNLSFYTSEDNVYTFFQRTGAVKRVVMGIDRIRHTPCGFCFVEYYNRRDTELAIHCLTGLKLDGREVRVDIDYGYKEGREFGRGRSGGQVRDEFRQNFDQDRGGYGGIVKKQYQQMMMMQEGAQGQEQQQQEQQGEAGGEEEEQDDGGPKKRRKMEE